MGREISADTAVTSDSSSATGRHLSNRSACTELEFLRLEEMEHVNEDHPEY